MQNTSQRAAFWMFVVLLFAYVINSMDRQLFAVLAPNVKQALSLTDAQSGLAVTIFTLGMGLAGIPTSFLLAKVSRRSVVLIGLVIFSVATIMTAYAHSHFDLLLYRFISGLGEAMQLTAILAIATSYFYRHRAIAASSLNFTFGVGAIIGPFVGGVLLEHYNWQMPLIVFGLLGIVPFIMVLIWVKPWFTEAIAGEVDEQKNSQDDLPQTIWSYTPMMLGIATVFAGLSIYGYLGLYPTYLREALGFSPKEAGFAFSFYGLGALASLFGGWLGDKFSYRSLLVGSLLFAAVIAGVLFSGWIQSLTMHCLFSFLFGISISGMVYANLSAGIIKSVDVRITSYASGLFVATLYIPAAFAGYAFALLKGSIGWDSAAYLQLAGGAVISALFVIIARVRVL